LEKSWDWSTSRPSESRRVGTRRCPACQPSSNLPSPSLLQTSGRVVVELWPGKVVVVELLVGDKGAAPDSPPVAKFSRRALTHSRRDCRSLGIGRAPLLICPVVTERCSGVGWAPRKTVAVKSFMLRRNASSSRERSLFDISSINLAEARACHISAKVEARPKS